MSCALEEGTRAIDFLAPPQIRLPCPHLAPSDAPHPNKSPSSITNSSDLVSNDHQAPQKIQKKTDAVHRQRKVRLAHFILDIAVQSMY